MGRVSWALLLTLVGLIRSRAATDDEKARECEADFKREFGLGILEGVERSMGPFRASAMGPKITENDLMPGLCDMTLLMWNNTLYLHPRTNPNRLVGDLRNAAGKPRPGMASVAHPEFVHGLHVSLDSVTRTLGVQRLPDVEFNLLTMDNVNCFSKTVHTHDQKPPRAVAGIVHHSLCHPDLCNGTLLLPVSYNQHIIAMQTSLKADNLAPPWHKRRNAAVWRGASNTGKMDFVLRFKPDYPSKLIPRQLLLKMVGKRKDLVDANAKFTPWGELLQFKYHLAVVGNTYASSFKHSARAGQLVIRQEEIMYEWFEPYFEPWTHYVPMRFDLSDLWEKVEWARAHDEEARAIAERARERALKLFSPRFMACYVLGALRGYRAMTATPLDELPLGAQPLRYICKKGKFCEPFKQPNLPSECAPQLSVARTHSERAQPMSPARASSQHCE